MVPRCNSPSSSISSDEGIREENTEESVVNQVSSSTLNDKGMSLHTFPIESEIFAEKSGLSMQTFLNDSYVLSLLPKRDMNFSIFFSQIPPSDKTNQFAVSNFEYTISPRPLSMLTSVAVDIPACEKRFSSRQTHIDPEKSDLCSQTVTTSEIWKTPLSISTFQDQFLPVKNLQCSENLRKLQKQMEVLQNLFQKVKITRELNRYTIKQRNKSPKVVEIKQFVESAAVQTLKNSGQTTDFSESKLESLNFKCEYYEAVSQMIRKYPFYYDFLKMCYSGRYFGCYEKFKHLKPKQKNFKAAVVHALRNDEKHLVAINFILGEVYKGHGQNIIQKQ